MVPVAIAFLFHKKLLWVYVYVNFVVTKHNKMGTEYQLLVKTNSYAGNFERELCAFMTGHIGDCEVGEELIEQFVKSEFSGLIRQESDDHACYRPVALDPKDANNFIIFLHGPLTKEQFELAEERAKIFEIERPYEYLHKDFKFLGLTLQKVTTNQTAEEVVL